MQNSPNTFKKLLANTLVTSITNALVWFAVTYWVFLETHSVFATALIAGIFTILNASSALFFGAIVDHHKKKTAMLFSSGISLIAYILASGVFWTLPSNFENGIAQTNLWGFIFILMFGSVAGNLRTLALSTSVSLFFQEDDRSKANGQIGMINGISFSVTSIASGLLIGFLGMEWVLGVTGFLTIDSILHLANLKISEPQIVHIEGKKHMDITGTINVIRKIPGMPLLIFFTTFNNFLGGVFMALMDAYGLYLVSVQAWGILWGALSCAFILGGILISRFGLGKNPIRTLFIINSINWITCLIFPIQASVVLLSIGMFLWLLFFPFIEASEQTILQKVVPYERQGRVMGFAQSIESAASPITTFLVGPLAQFVFIPFMTTGHGVAWIGSWFGTGPDRGIALVFILAGLIGILVTAFTWMLPSRKHLSEIYTKGSLVVE